MKMSEPIVLRSEAVTALANQINGVQDSGNEGVSETVSNLSSDIQSSASNIAGIMNDIASMKQSIALLQTNVNKLAQATPDIAFDLTVTDPDAPSAEPGDSSAPAYSVSTGAVNSSVFLSNSTSFARHYTYDNLHMIILSLGMTSQSFPSSFTDGITFNGALSGFSGHGYLPAWAQTYQQMVKIDGTKLKVATGTAYAINVSDYQTPHYYSYFWFDRGADARLPWNFEDGSIVSSVASTAAPSFATYANLGNIHFLHISTVLVANVAKNTQVNIAQFINNMTITTGINMGFGWATRIATDCACLKFQVVAPSTNTISIVSVDELKAGDYISINLMWIDNRAAQQDCTITTGSTGLTTTDAFARHVNHGRLHLAQMYGSTSGKKTNIFSLGEFSETLNHSIPTNPVINTIVPETVSWRFRYKSDTNSWSTATGSYGPRPSDYSITLSDKKKFTVPNNTGMLDYCRYLGENAAKAAIGASKYNQNNNSLTNDQKIQNTYYDSYTGYQNVQFVWFA